MALGLLAAAAVSLLATGCGRRGDPERPPSAAAVATTDEEGTTAETKSSKDRPFILDGLIQ
jgi:predicted small lipoprotein YifL